MLAGRLLMMLFALGGFLRGQVIEFYSNGLKYQTLTKSGVTVMCAEMPLQVRSYAVLQVAVINGSSSPRTVQPSWFSFESPEGRAITAAAEQQVIAELQQHGGRNDVIKLVTAYERAIYGAEKLRSNNGYEQRRQAALAMGSAAGLKAAAAASAIALVRTRLRPKDSTDGAVFFVNEGKPLGPGILRVHVDNELFEFRSE
ncbi:MAG: hypothetical protein HY236_12270 [Acidobacteria bacterium]|nr:hypothetical protein [Acidobacteriota bacterium]